MTAVSAGAHRHRRKNVPLIRKVARYHRLAQETGVLVAGIESDSPARPRRFARLGIVVALGFVLTPAVDALHKQLTAERIGECAIVTFLSGVELRRRAIIPWRYRRLRLALEVTEDRFGVGLLLAGEATQRQVKCVAREAQHSVAPEKRLLRLQVKREREAVVGFDRGHLFHVGETQRPHPRGVGDAPAESTSSMGRFMRRQCNAMAAPKRGRISKPTLAPVLAIPITKSAVTGARTTAMAKRIVIPLERPFHVTGGECCSSSVRPSAEV